MNVDDPRVRFYLKHREQFAEWFELRTDAATAIDNWLIQLRPDVDLLHSDLGADVYSHFETADEHGWPGMYLLRTWWPKPSPGSPMIGLQWTRRKTLMLSSSAPWLGVRADRRQSAGRAIHASSGFQEERRTRKDSSTQWWQSLRYVVADADFPESALQFKTSLLDELKRTWLSYSPHVDAALAAGEPHDREEPDALGSEPR